MYYTIFEYDYGFYNVCTVCGYNITVTGFIYPLTCGFAFMMGRVRTMVPAATRSRSTLRIKDTKRLSKRTELICRYCMIYVSAPEVECMYNDVFRTYSV